MYLIIRVPSEASCTNSEAQLKVLGEWLEQCCVRSTRLLAPNPK